MADTQEGCSARVTVGLSNFNESSLTIGAPAAVLYRNLSCRPTGSFVVGLGTERLADSGITGEVTVKFKIFLSGSGQDGKCPRTLKETLVIPAGTAANEQAIGLTLFNVAAISARVFSTVSADIGKTVEIYVDGLSHCGQCGS